VRSGGLPARSPATRSAAALVTWAALLAPLGGLGCAPAPRRASSEHPSVLLIAVDTLRADRLGCCGSDRGLTPRIDRLASEGALFTAAFAHAPWTLPSFATMLTSTTPDFHGAGGKVDDFRGLRPGIPTLAERLRDAGYATAAVVNVDFLARPFGVTRGFEHLDAQAFEDNENLRPAAPTTDAALGWLRDHRGESFCLLVHYFDPHAEYRPPEAFRRRFAAPSDREDASFRFGTRRQVVEHRIAHAPLVPADVERAERLYDGEVAYVDQEVGRLLDGLASLALDETTLVVFTADHGEEFLDHGDWEHGHSLYDELLRVPLVLRQKGRLAPLRVTGGVGHVDLAPTILGWCGLPPCPSFRGRDLGPALRGGLVQDAALLAYGNFWGAPLASLREGDLQLIRRASGRPELYRWSEDPAEKHDIEPEFAERADELHALLESTLAESRSAASPGPRVELTPDQIRRLRAAGYAGDEGTTKD
jgi:arylsulfatase A-like enzyme